jgi:16S rRNA (uracil1498-N3)-methyltransferase
VTRRLHVSNLFVGQVPLDPAQARHARDVLRLKAGDEVELFDDAGIVAIGTLLFPNPKDVTARVECIEQAHASTGLKLTVASAVPKGERADWMIEKLSELGVAVFVPLSTQRSVVKPEGNNKRERWARIATESAKQSRRLGVMRVEELHPVEAFLGRMLPALYLSTSPDATPIQDLILNEGIARELAILIGPEGGWTDAEIEAFRATGMQGVKLTTTILRIETAAVAGAALVMVLGDRLEGTSKAHRAAGRGPMDVAR